MDIILQGLQLSLVGIAVTFSALGLFILVILLLQRLFGREMTRDEAAKPSQPEPLPSRETEIAAAIALALNHALAHEDAALGQALTKGRGPWWARQQMLEPPPAISYPPRSDTV